MSDVACIQSNSGIDVKEATGSLRGHRMTVGMCIHRSFACSALGVSLRGYSDPGPLGPQIAGFAGLQVWHHVSSRAATR